MSKLDKELQKISVKIYNKYKNLYCFGKQVNRKEAETILKADCRLGRSGVFLIRESAAHEGDFVLSFTYGNNICHHIIKKDLSQRYKLVGFDTFFPGLDALITYYQSTEDGLPTKLTKPCKSEDRLLILPPITIFAGFENILHTSLLKKNEAQALAVLKSSDCPDINWRDSRGSTALHLSSKLGFVDATRKCLEKFADVSAVDADGFCALQLAAKNNHHIIMELLVKVGAANIEQRHVSTRNVSLHEAAIAGHVQCIKTLLSLGATAWTRNIAMKTPYALAVENNRTECQTLLDNHQPALARTTRSDWLHENLTREQSVQLLENLGLQEGLFLVRFKSTNNYVLSFCFESKVIHNPILSMTGDAFYLHDGPLFASLEHLVEYYSLYEDFLQCLLTIGVSADGKPHPLKAEELYAKALDMPASQYSLQRAVTLCRQAIPTPPSIAPPTALSFQEDKQVPCRINKKNLILGAELGQGEFGSVFKGVWIAPNGTKVDTAIKTLNDNHASSGKSSFLREAEIMMKLDHSCIVKLIGICEGPPLMIIQELMPLGALLDFMLDYPERIRISPDLYIWAAQVAAGMKYLEMKKFVHRDLAARNILLASKTAAKVGDFGLSRSVSSCDEYQASQGGRWPVKWYAPEAVYYGTFSSSSDVWSYGVVLWEMFSFGQQPYGETKGSEVLKLIDSGKRLAKPDNCPQHMYDLMQQCWTYESTRRPTFSELYEQVKSHLETMGSSSYLYVIEYLGQ